MSIRWGIIGAGGIAHKFADGLKASQTGDLVATGSRRLEKGQAFAAQWGGVGYGSYQEVYDDPEVDAVYIATPHHCHWQDTINAARAGKAILCEKPFTLNSLEARRALEVVETEKVFFMEAFMYRCSPQTRKLVELLKDGAIGTIRAVNAEFSFNASKEWDNFRLDPAVGGGGIMDVGTYCVSFTRMVAGEEPDRVEYAADLEQGYDAYGVGCLQFPSGILGHFACGVHVSMKNDATVYGDAGMIHLQDPWKSPEGTVVTLTRPGRDPEIFSLGCSNAKLYAYEIDAVADFLAEGECPYMTMQDTLDNMATLDRLRQSAGLHFAREMV
jgi:predicted dehydrogenase